MRRLKIAANPALFAGGILCILIFFVISFGFAFFLEFYPSATSSPSDRRIIQAMFIFLGVAMIIAEIICAPRWFSVICFSSEGVCYRTAFKKAVIQPYSSYTYIYNASYFHGSIYGMGYRPRFVVLSQKRLSENELQQINNVEASEKVIKIRYTKKSFELIKKVLPEKQCCALLEAFSKE